MKKSPTTAPIFEAIQHRSLIVDLANALDVPLSEAQIEQCLKYLTLIAQWNSRHNLTAASNAKDLVEIMLADSFMLKKFPWPTNAHIVDIGSGAGAPAIAWLIVCETLSCVCVEKLNKRRAFLSFAVGSLGLNARMSILETTENSPEQKFDIACSRATFSPKEWFERATKLADSIIVFVTEQNENNFDPPPTHQLVSRLDYHWPWSNKARAILHYHVTH